MGCSISKEHKYKLHRQDKKISELQYYQNELENHLTQTTEQLEKIHLQKEKYSEQAETTIDLTKFIQDLDKRFEKINNAISELKTLCEAVQNTQNAQPKVEKQSIAEWEKVNLYI